jgi:hypothetical protein
VSSRGHVTKDLEFFSLTHGPARRGWRLASGLHRRWGPRGSGAQRENQRGSGTRRGSGRVGGFCARTEMIFLFPESIFHSTYKSNNFGKNT